MRLLGRLLFLALLLPLLGWGASWAYATASRAFSKAVPGEREFPSVDRSLIYSLKRDAPVEFVLSRPQKLVRILTHADIHPRMANPRGSWRYSFLLEALDADGVPIMRREIFSRSVLLYFRDSRGRLIPADFYVDRYAVPAAADISLVEFPRPAARIRLTQGRADRGIVMLSARLYERRPIADRQLRIGWDRLNEQEQARLAQGNAFPADMLTQEEQRNLLANRWFPVGPAGIQGIHYERRTLYEREARQPLPPPQEVRPAPASELGYD